MGAGSSNLNIDALRGWVEDLRRCAGWLPAIGEATPTKTLEALLASFEELRVAEEELRQQNEELIAARDALDEEYRRSRPSCCGCSRTASSSAWAIRVDVRVIAATNRDLEIDVGSGQFRKDLYYRLQVFPITVPPLRDHREDIPLLVRFFVEKFARKSGKTIDTVPTEAMEALQRYPWPGNVRELQNVIERAVINTRGTGLRLMDTLGSPRVLFSKPPYPDACRVGSRVYRAGPRGDPLENRGPRRGRNGPGPASQYPAQTHAKAWDSTVPRILR